MNIYLERQKSIPWWLYAIAAPPFVVIWMNMYTALKETIPSEYSLSLEWLLWITLVVFGVIVPMSLLLSQQVTRVTKDRIFITFLPFWKTSFLLEEVEKFYIKQFDPYSDFGWGLRRRKGVIAITSYGNNKGIQFELKTGKKFFIGSSKINTFNAVVCTHLPKNS